MQVSQSSKCPFWKRTQFQVKLRSIRDQPTIQFLCCSLHDLSKECFGSIDQHSLRPCLLRRPASPPPPHHPSSGQLQTRRNARTTLPTENGKTRQNNTSVNISTFFSDSAYL